jgi:hypothetical protein
MERDAGGRGSGAREKQFAADQRLLMRVDRRSYGRSAPWTVGKPQLAVRRHDGNDGTRRNRIGRPPGRLPTNHLTGCDIRCRCLGSESWASNDLPSMKLPWDKQLHGTYGSRPRRDARSDRTSHARTRSAVYSQAGRAAKASLSRQRVRPAPTSPLGPLSRPKVRGISSRGRADDSPTA